MNIVIDIETCPSQNAQVKADFLANIQVPGQYKKPESIAEWLRDNGPAAADEQWRKTSFDGAHGHICVIGIAIDDSEPIALHAGKEWATSEASILKEMSEIIDAACKESPTQRPVFIGHNLIDFDLRFIFQRSIVLGIKPSIQIPFAARPWDDGVFDTMTRWSGTKDRVSLDKVCKALGLGGKGDIDGSKVWDYVNSGRIDEVAEYCKRDVEMTRSLYKRMTFQS